MYNYLTDDITQIVQLVRGEAALSYADGPFDSLRYGSGIDENVLYDEDQVPYFMWGHKLEIANRLTAKGKDKVFKYQRYPLIVLVLDPTKNDTKVRGGMVDYNLNILIVNYAEIGLNAEERMLSSFKPILYPLYDSFIYHIVHSGLFQWAGDQEHPPHDFYLRPYWGTPSPNKNVKNMLNDPLDAIEIQNLKVSAIVRHC